MILKFFLDNLENSKTYYWTVIPYLGEIKGNCTSGIRSFKVDLDYNPKKDEDNDTTNQNILLIISIIIIILLILIILIFIYNKKKEKNKAIKQKQEQLIKINLQNTSYQQYTQPQSQQQIQQFPQYRRHDQQLTRTVFPPQIRPQY